MKLKTRPLSVVLLPSEACRGCSTNIICGRHSVVSPCSQNKEESGSPLVLQASVQFAVRICCIVYCVYCVITQCDWRRRWQGLRWFQSQAMLQSCTRYCDLLHKPAAHWERQFACSGGKEVRVPVTD